jgi:hypothetical protein
MSRSEAFKAKAGAGHAADGRRARGDQRLARPLEVVVAAQGTRRKRRSKRPLRRLAAIVPVSDYRDVVG